MAASHFPERVERTGLNAERGAGGCRSLLMLDGSSEVDAREHTPIARFHRHRRRQCWCGIARGCAGTRTRDQIGRQFAMVVVARGRRAQTIPAARSFFVLVAGCRRLSSALRVSVSPAAKEATVEDGMAAAEQRHQHECDHT